MEKNGRRRFIKVATAGAAVSAWGGFSQSLAQNVFDREALFANVSQSVIKVTASYSGATPKFGTACMVDVMRSDGKVEQRFLTALHVLALEANGKPVPRDQVTVKLHFENEDITAGLESVHPTDDLAILRPFSSLPVPAMPSLPIAQQVPAAQERLYVLGPILDFEGIIIDNTFELRDADYRGTDPNGFMYCLPPPEIWNGKSGSPVLNKNGEITGVLTDQRQPVVVGKAFPIKCTPANKVEAFIKNPQVFANLQLPNKAEQGVGGFLQVAGQPQAMPAGANNPPIIAGQRLAMQFRAVQAGIDVSQACLRLATQGKQAPPRLNVNVNQKIGGRLGVGRVTTEEGDVYLENGMLGFDTLLGKTFTRTSEFVSLDNKSMQLQAESADGQHVVNLHVSKVSFPLWSFVMQNLAQPNVYVGNLQNELASRRKDILKLWLDGNDDERESIGKDRVVFGPLLNHRILSPNDNLNDWTIFNGRHGLPYCLFRYRSYQSVNQDFELICLYVYHVPSGHMYTAWFRDLPNRTLANVGGGPLFEKWIFLLGLRIWE